MCFYTFSFAEESLGPPFCDSFASSFCLPADSSFSMSAWPQCQGRFWNRSSRVTSHSMCRTSRGSGSASMGHDKQILLDQPHLILWSSDHPGGRGKGCWCGLPRLQPSLWHCLPQYFSGEAGSPWPGQLHFAGWRAGWRAGPREWWWMELNPADDRSWVMFSRDWYCHLSCLISLLMTWMMALSAPSVSLQMTPSWEEVLWG